jgi:tetratricopeptide (TPR) repeat protein
MIIRSPRCAAACLVLCLFPAVCSFGADRAEQLMEAAHWKRAKAVVQERLKANANDAQARYELSKIEENFDDIEAAVEPAEQAIALDDRNASYHAQLAEVYALMAEKSGVLKQLSYVHKMRREVDATFAIDPRNVDALLVETAFHWKAPVVVGGGRQKSLKMLDELKSISPLWGSLMEARLFQNEDLHRTQAALEAAANLAPPFYRARVLLADFYIEKLGAPRFADAERLANACIQADPGRAGAWSTLAKIQAETGRYTELETTLANAEKNVPDDLSPYYFAAKILLDKNKEPQRAEQYLRKYLSQPPEGLEPKMPAARVLLATAESRKTARAALRPVPAVGSAMSTY